MQFTLVFLVDRARFGFQFSQPTSVSGYLVPLGLHTSFLLDTTTPQIAAIAKTLHSSGFLINYTIALESILTRKFLFIEKKSQASFARHFTEAAGI